MERRGHHKVLCIFNLGFVSTGLFLSKEWSKNFASNIMNMGNLIKLFNLYLK